VNQQDEQESQDQQVFIPTMQDTIIFHVRVGTIYQSRTSFYRHCSF